MCVVSPCSGRYKLTSISAIAARTSSASPCMPGRVDALRSSLTSPEVHHEERLTRHVGKLEGRATHLCIKDICTPPVSKQKATGLWVNVEQLGVRPAEESCELSL